MHKTMVQATKVLISIGWDQEGYITTALKTTKAQVIVHSMELRRDGGMGVL